MKGILKSKLLSKFSSSSSTLTTAATDALGIPRQLYCNITAVGNIDAGADTLMSYTMPANTLKTNKDYIEVEGTFSIGEGPIAGSGIVCMLGSSVVWSTGNGISTGQAYTMIVRIYRVSPSKQKITIKAFEQQSVSNTIDWNDCGVGTTYITTAENLTTSLVLKFTGEGTNNDDIVQKTMTVIYNPAI